MFEDILTFLHHKKKFDYGVLDLEDYAFLHSICTLKKYMQYTCTCTVPDTERGGLCGITKTTCCEN